MMNIVCDIGRIFAIRIRFLVTSLLLWIFLSVTAFGQINQDSLNKVQDIKADIQKAESFLVDGSALQGLSMARLAYDKASNLNHNQLKGRSLGLISEAYRITEDYNNSLKYILWALRTFELVNDYQRTAEYSQRTALLYLDMNAYKKAKEYLLKYRELSEKSSVGIVNEVDYLQNLAYVHLQLQEYAEAQSCYESLITLFGERKDTLALTETYNVVSDIFKNLKDYEKALSYNFKLLEVYQTADDLENMSNTYNNIGFLYKKQNDLKNSVDYFNKAISLEKQISANTDAIKNRVLLTNIGIAYTNLEAYLRAKEYFVQALKLSEEKEDWVGKGHIHNHLASNYLVSGKTSLAQKEVMTAVELGLTYDSKEVLATSYYILSLLYEVDNNPSRAKLFAEKYEELKTTLADRKVDQTKALIQRQAFIERKEEEIKTLLVEEEQNAVEKERKSNELKLKEKELAILRQDQKLKMVALQNNRLEKEKAEQALALAYKELQVEKQTREVKELEKSRQLQELRLEQQKLEKDKQEKTIALLEADRQLKDQKIFEEIARRRYAYGIIGLCVVVLGVAGFSFRQKQKDNQKLKKHQGIIEEQNSQLVQGEKVLRQNVEALESAQVTLAQQKQILESQHRKTQESIEYAQRIQSSILPDLQQCQGILADSFIIYKPKDIVSGDFYWISRHQDKGLISVVDCTGHGVPGALMSLIGNNALNEAINENRIYDPASVLSYIDQKIIQQLHKEGHKLNDGMDLGMCLVEPLDQEYVKLIYSGAKNALFVMSDEQLLVIKGDRKSIGTVKHDFQYTNQELVLKKGSSVYLTSDGYIDQANPERVRFGSKKFKAMIEDIHFLKMSDQKWIIEQALEDHQMDAEQRDDINVIGFRL